MVTLVDAGIEAVARMINGVSAPAAFTFIALGSGSTAESTSQTALVTELTTNGAARAAATCSYVATGIAKLLKLFSFTGAVTLREFGAFNASSGGTMLCRNLLSADKVYASGEAVEITISVTLTRV